MTRDLNKDIGTASVDGIVYNHLNLPAAVTVRNTSGIKGVIRYVYDAVGNKLQKRTEEAGVDTTTTDYLGALVYRNDSLQFAGHEEGRIRQTLQGKWMYDYFIKDHLGNTRMVLTEESQRDAYPVASLETGTLTNEQLYYNIPDGGSVRVNKETIAGYPTDNYTSPNDYVHKLNGNGTKVGSSMVLKVMSGDTVNLHANSWYKLNSVTPDQPANPLTELLSALATGVSSRTMGKLTITDLLNSGVLTPGMQEMLNKQVYSSSKPKAYLNWVLFDEQFKYVDTGSGFKQVTEEDVLETHTVTDMVVPRNGYLYIYVSNETPNVDSLPLQNCMGCSLITYR
jgi:hypothetical protein